MSNSITCNLTISAFYLLSFFIYLLSLSICLLSLFIYLLSLFCYLLFVSAFISFSFLYEFYFLFSFSFSFLSARRIFVHNYFLFLLYGGAQSPVTQHSPNSSYFFYMGVHNRQWHNIPLIFLISFILNPPPSSMVRSQNVGMWTDT